MIMVGSFKIVFNQSCFLSVENNNRYETNVLPKEEITNADIFWRGLYRSATHDFSSADDAERAEVSPSPLILGHHQVSHKHLTIQCCNCHWKRKRISTFTFTNKGISTKSNFCHYSFPWFLSDIMKLFSVTSKYFNCYTAWIVKSWQGLSYQ